MANLNQLLSTQGETHLHPKTHITPISVMWSIRQTVMGDHVPSRIHHLQTNKSNIHDSRRTNERTAVTPKGCGDFPGQRLG